MSFNIKQYRKEYNKKHIFKVRLYRKKYNKKHSKKLSIYGKQWRKDNPEYGKKWMRSTVKGRYSCYKEAAKHRGIPFKLTLEQFFLFWQKPCFVTGCTERIATIGLDRIDNSKGYIMSNVRSCCTAHNKIKLDFSDKKCYKLCKLFVEHYERCL